MSELTSGFYKNDEELLFGPNSVLSNEFELYASLKNTYTYPVEGWYWFDTIEEANIFFNITT